jgi:hypothetical protein
VARRGRKRHERRSRIELIDHGIAATAAAIEGVAVARRTGRRVLLFGAFGAAAAIVYVALRMRSRRAEPANDVRPHGDVELRVGESAEPARATAGT